MTGPWLDACQQCGTAKPLSLAQYCRPCRRGRLRKAARARARERARAKTLASLAAEVEHLLGTDTPDNIARRLGSPTPDAMERRLIRAGRPDLAAHFRTQRRFERAA